MAEFTEVMRQRERICSIFRNRCADCPLSIDKNGTDNTCVLFIFDCSIDAEHIIIAWARANPEKTLADVFFERNPEAPKSPWNTPMMCPHYIGLADRPKECESSEESSARDCEKCWSRPYDKGNKSG